MNSRVRVVVADDEFFGRQVVKEFLKDDDRIEIAAEAATGEKTIEAILNFKPDILFLDIQMPEPSGLDLIKEIEPDQRPIVIFTTAHDQYAIKAFEVGAVDYLLKPFDQSRFDVALTKALELVNLRKMNGQGQPVQQPGEGHLARILIKEPKRIYFIKAEDIYWFEASGDYVILHTESKSHLINYSLTELEQRLNPENFVRIHRSTIVNVSVISEFEPYFNGEYFITLKNKTKVKLSRTYRDKLKVLFSDISGS